MEKCTTIFLHKIHNNKKRNYFYHHRCFLHRFFFCNIKIWNILLLLCKTNGIRKIISEKKQKRIKNGSKKIN